MLRVHGFYGHVRRNDLASVATFAGFLLAFQAGAAAALAVPLVFLDFSHSLLFPGAYAARYVPLTLLLGAALFALRFARHVASVQADLHFVTVGRRDEPRLVNQVETLAIAAGLPLPDVGLIETPACNAFACGLSRASAVVVVTRGLLDTLDDRELAAVIAHEIAHIRNGDIRMMAAANVLLDLLLLVQRGHVLRISNWRRAIVAVLLPPYLLVAAFLGLLSNGSVLLARVSRLVIASSREFVADAEAVRLTQDPEALISALQRIEGRSTIPGLSLAADAMMIDGAVAGPFANHPPIAERIAVLARLSATVMGRRPFGRRLPKAAPALAIPDPLAPARRLVERVNDGATENVFGIPPAAQRVMLTGFILLAALQFWAMWSVRSTLPSEARQGASAGSGFEHPSARETRAVVAWLPHSNDIIRIPAVPSASSQANCFATAAYRPADRGLPAKPIDSNLVEAYRSGRRSDEGVAVLERYLAMRLRALRAVEGRLPAERDHALLEYVRTRTHTLTSAHRYFGEAGLTRMRRAYDSPEDRAVLATLRTSLAAGTLPFPVYESRLRADVDALLAAPAAFVPCRALASTTEGASRSAAAPFDPTMYGPCSDAGRVWRPFRPRRSLVLPSTGTRAARRRGRSDRAPRSDAACSQASASC